MFKVVFVPLEGTFLAERAAGYAISMARRWSARLDLYHWTRPLAIESHPVEERAAALELDSLAAQGRASGVDAAAIVDHNSSTDIATAIVDAASTRHADLIVIASHGRSGIEDAVLGSTAERVARRSEVPVLVIPPEYDQPWDADPQLRVLVALDGSPEAEVALNEARMFREAYHGTMSLAYCVESRRSQPAEIAEYIEQGRTYLARLETSLRTDGVQVDSIVETGEPGELLPRFCSERDIDLLVMASHGRGGFKRLALGSVAETTLRSTRVPVLITRRPPSDST